MSGPLSSWVPWRVRGGWDCASQSHNPRPPAGERATPGVSLLAARPCVPNAQHWSEGTHKQVLPVIANPDTSCDTVSVDAVDDIMTIGNKSSPGQQSNGIHMFRTWVSVSLAGIRPKNVTSEPVTTRPYGRERWRQEEMEDGEEDGRPADREPKAGDWSNVIQTGREQKRRYAYTGFSCPCKSWHFWLWGQWQSQPRHTQWASKRFSLNSIVLHQEI